MEYSRQTAEYLTNRFGSPLYVFDEEGFVRNYRDLEEAMRSRYENYRISYSFKTNYTPYICSVVKRLGGYAEVVSGMEYAIARKVGFEDKHIIFNGPDKGEESEEAFLNGCMVHADSLDELGRYCAVAEKHPEQNFQFGLRIHLNIAEGFVSRFGMDDNDAREAFRVVSTIDNLRISGLHCHISRCRGLDAWKKRAEYMLTLADKLFEEVPEYIDLGSGMFGSMAPELAAQFDEIPSYDDYAQVTAALFEEHYRGGDRPLLFTEPGTTLINRFVDCITEVKAVKQLAGHSFAVMNASEHNLGETCRLKRLPIQVIPRAAERYDYENIDLTGYTCLEQDVLYSGYSGRLGTGDVVVFGNTGGYSNVLKPPFIRPNCSMTARKADGTFVLIKSAETCEDILRTYVF